LSGGLTSGTTYGFSVFACNSQLVCSAPATTTFLAKANEIPAVSVSGQTDTSAVVAWSTLSGTSGYRIGRGADDAELPTTPADPDFVWADDSAPPYTLTGLSPSVGYSVVVVPMYADGGWGAYGVSGFSTTAPPPPPATGLSAVLSSAGTVTLNWSSASSPSGGWSIVGHNGATDTISLPCPNTTGVCFNLGGAGGSARTFTITSAQIGNGQGSKWFFGVTPMTSEGVRGTTAKVAVVPWSAAKLAPLYIGSTPSYSGGVYKMNLQWENPPQPNWTHIKVFIAAGTTAPSDSGTPVYSCVRSTGCVKSKLVSALANGTKLVNGAKYSFSAYAYVSPTSPQQKARAFGTDTARATGVVINGAWVTNSLPPHYYGEVELAFDSTGKQHLVYPRETGLYYASKPAGGAWTSSVKIPGTSGSDNYAELTVLSNNTLVLGFNRFGAGPYLLTKTSAGAWSAASRIGATTPASGTSAYVFQNLVRDSANGLHVLISRSSYPAKSTDGLFYLKRVSGGAWSAVTKIPGTTGYDYGLLSIDSSRTKLGLAFGRSGHPTASSNGAFAAVKAPAAANFPTPARIASNVTNTEFYPTGMTIHGTRVQVFLDRSAYPAQATDGVYLRKGLLGGTAAAPTVNWGAAAAARVAGTTAADFMCGVAVNPANGEMTMCLDRDGAASISGLYLLKSTTAGVWGGTAAVKKTAADYDYVTDVDYYANAVYFTWLRH
jgi:hypothetical protein